MTRLQFIQTERICNLLNLLAADTIFKIEAESFSFDEDDVRAAITCKNTAYRNELNLLIILLDSMTPTIDTRETTVTIK